MLKSSEKEVIKDSYNDILCAKGGFRTLYTNQHTENTLPYIRAQYPCVGMKDQRRMCVFFVFGKVEKLLNFIEMSDKFLIDLRLLS